MKITWANIDGEWCVKITEPEYWPEQMIGLPYTVTAASGRKKRVILGELVKKYRIKGGRWVDIYRVEREI